jgi:hypothetical protein
MVNHFNCGIFNVRIITGVESCNCIFERNVGLRVKYGLILKGGDTMNKKILMTLGILAGIIVVLLLLHFGMSRLIPMIQQLHNGGNL